MLVKLIEALVLSLIMLASDVYLVVGFLDFPKFNWQILVKTTSPGLVKCLATMPKYMAII